MTNFVTEQMCEGLRLMQGTRGFDFAGAEYCAFAGFTALDPRNPSDAEFIYGRILAARVYRDRQIATLALR